MSGETGAALISVREVLAFWRKTSRTTTLYLFQYILYNSQVFQANKLLFDDSSYPNCLKQMAKPPQSLYVAGELLDTDFDGIAVVGSRLITSYGESVIQAIVGELAVAGFTIVSGLAFGVDVAAQKLALELGGRTIAVLGSGINKMAEHPNYQVAKRILNNNQGAVISTYGPDVPAHKGTFIERDYLMAALSKAVLVIEAAQRSGTSHTVNAALELGKEVFVVPGSIFSPFSVGCHNYIKNGAHLVTCAQDIFDVLEPETTRKEKKVGQIKFESKLEESLFLSLDAYGMALETLSEKLQEPASKVLSALTMLELRGLVKRDGDKFAKL